MGTFRIKSAAAYLAAAALFATAPALAQRDSIEMADAAAPAPAATAAPAAGGAELQEVTVSASAITISGYDQPTPVTSLGIQQLQSSAQPDLSDAVRSLPAFAASSSPQNTNQSNNISNGQAGLDQLNLRNLGVNRTLLLIDGQRVVNGSIYGGAETSNIPASLVQRVDVVTGGASAIWGSDAVAGVVNYILNHNFNGVQIEAEYGNNSQSEHQQYRGEITFGTGFADERGHIEGSVAEWRVPNAYYVHQSEGFAFQRLVNNPACNLAAGTPNPLTGNICGPGQAWLVHANNVGLAFATPGGLITGCNDAAGAAIAGCALTNTYFVGPNATPQAFNPGNVTADFFTNGGTRNTDVGDGEIKGVPQKTDTAFLLGSFKITDHVRATAQFNFGYTSFLQNSYDDIQYGNGNPAVIYSGNPYIPASIQAQMGGIGSLNIGTTNTNPFTGPAPNLTAQGNAVGMIELFESRRMMRGVIGLDGDLGDKWTWNAYYQRSETHQFETGLNNNIYNDLLNAEDAVRVGSYNAHYTAGGAYPNPLGLPAGSITCLSNLLPVGALGRTTNCAPLNIFGNGPGVASQEAIQYVNGVTRAGGEADHTNLFEDVGAVSLQGVLPFGMSAGPIAMAVGAQYRDELGFRPNCGPNCSEVNFAFGNFANFKGNYNVKEGSLEFNAPILKDSFVKDLSIDAAYRAIDYSTSGFVQTYKFGVVSQLTDAVRFRASYSRDIRAGNMFETFAQAQTIGTSGPNPKLNNGSTALFVVAGGNQNIQPEQAETRTAGFVFTPFQGFTSSIDWYYIRIKDVINQGFSVGQIVSLCEQGQGKYCADLVWGKYPGGCSSANINDCASNVLAGVIATAVNSDWETTSGVDFLADYRMPFGAGTFDFNLDSNYVFELRYNSLGTTCDPMNGLGFDQYLYPACAAGGVPKFRGTLSTSYAQGAWLGTIQVRGIGAAHLVSNWTSGVQVDNNDIPFQTYVDLRLSFKFDNGVSIYGAIDNTFDRWQPITPFTPFSATAYEPPLRDDIYDGFGRVWRIGVRAKF